MKKLLEKLLRYFSQGLSYLIESALWHVAISSRRVNSDIRRGTRADRVAKTSRFQVYFLETSRRLLGRWLT